METKYNEATINRPEGERLLDASILMIDFEKYITQLKDENAWDKNDRNGITVYKTKGLTIVLTCLHKNATIENNSVNGVLTIQVMDGAIEFMKDDNLQVLKKNQAVAIHPRIQHSIRAKKESTLLLINAEQDLQNN